MTSLLAGYPHSAPDSETISSLKGKGIFRLRESKEGRHKGRKKERDGGRKLQGERQEGMKKQREEERNKGKKKETKG